MKPLVVSWGYESEQPSASQFLDYHQMQGTRDFSAFLTTGSAIQYMKDHDWLKQRDRCRALVIEQAGRFCELLRSEPLCPLTVEFVPQLFSIPINTQQPEKLKQVLYERYRIEIPVTRLHDRYFIRYSIQVFNTVNDLDKLYAALKYLLEKEPALLQTL